MSGHCTRSAGLYRMDRLDVPPPHAWSFPYDGKTTSAHRTGWILFRGPIPAGLKVLHACDNPACVNLEHLYLGTQKDNARDMVARGRYASGNARKTHCKRGHAFTPENTSITLNGHRRCRACRRV